MHSLPSLLLPVVPTCLSVMCIKSYTVQIFLIMDSTDVCYYWHLHASRQNRINFSVKFRQWCPIEVPRSIVSPKICKISFFLDQKYAENIVKCRLVASPGIRGCLKSALRSSRPFVHPSAFALTSLSVHILLPPPLSALCC